MGARAHPGPIGVCEELLHDLPADALPPVLREQSEIDDQALQVRPMHPHAADGPVAEHDHLVIGGGEGVAPTGSLRLELVREERLAGLVGPVGNLGSCRRVEIAQELLVRLDGGPPLGTRH